MWKGAAFALALGLMPSAAGATVGDATAWLVDATAGADCAFAFAKELLRRGILLPESAVPCTEIANVASDGAYGDNGGNGPAFDATGRRIAFHSFSTNLVGGLPSTLTHAYARDRVTGATALLSAATDGTPGNSVSTNVSMSGDGRHVAFSSRSSNLVPGTNLATRVYVRDRDTDRDGVFDEIADVDTVLVTRNPAGLPRTGDFGVLNAGGGGVAPGRFVAIQAGGVDLVGTTILGTQVYVHDRDADADDVFDEDGGTSTVWISTTYDGDVGGSTGAAGPAMSASGRYVAFHSGAATLLPPGEDTNAKSDVFVRDRDTDGDLEFDESGSSTTIRVSVSSAGGEGDEFSTFAGISADGRFVTWESRATTLDPACANGLEQIFVRDRDTDENGIYDEPAAVETRCVSVDTFGDPGDAACKRPRISPSGRYVIYQSQARNLVEEGTNGQRNVFLYDRLTDETTRVSVRNTGEETTQRSGDDIYAAAVADGDPLVAFVSQDEEIAFEDMNGQADVFLRDYDALTVP